MKKFTYSAVAIVLFSFAGIASEKNETVKQKESASLSVTRLETTEDVKGDPRTCQIVATALTALYEMDNGSISDCCDYYEIYNHIYNNCMNS